MPTLAIFYGIVVKLNTRNEHNPPHVHVFYGEEEACFNFDGEIIARTFPKNKTTLVQAWVQIHHDELLANWNLAKNHEKVFKIPPLK